jgi:hypothetical protein
VLENESGESSGEDKGKKSKRKTSSEEAKDGKGKKPRVGGSRVDEPTASVTAMMDEMKKQHAAQEKKLREELKVMLKNHKVESDERKKEEAKARKDLEKLEREKRDKRDDAARDKMVAEFKVQLSNSFQVSCLPTLPLHALLSLCGYMELLRCHDRLCDHRPMSTPRRRRRQRTHWVKVDRRRMKRKNTQRRRENVRTRRERRKKRNERSERNGRSARSVRSARDARNAR